MNKKGFDFMIVVGIVLAILFLLIATNAMGVNILKPLKSISSCPSEDRCVLRTDGCQTVQTGRTEAKGKLCKDSKMMCCLTPEEQANMDPVKPAGKAPDTTTGNPSSTPAPNVPDEVKIQAGDDIAYLSTGSSLSLKGGIEKQFKIWVVGSNAKLCSIRLLDAFKAGNAIKPTWFNGGADVTKVACTEDKTVTIKMTPPYDATLGATNQYKLDVMLYNATEEKWHASSTLYITVTK